MDYNLQTIGHFTEMQFPGAYQMQEEETQLEKIKRITSETLWIVSTSAFVLIFPIYLATRL